MLFINLYAEDNVFYFIYNCYDLLVFNIWMLRDSRK